MCCLNWICHVQRKVADPWRSDFFYFFNCQFKVWTKEFLKNISSFQKFQARKKNCRNLFMRLDKGLFFAGRNLCGLRWTKTFYGQLFLQFDNFLSQEIKETKKNYVFCLPLLGQKPNVIIIFAHGTCNHRISVCVGGGWVLSLEF